MKQFRYGRSTRWQCLRDGYAVLVIAALLSGCGGSTDTEQPAVIEPPVIEPIPTVVTDPVRGASLFANTPQAGQLICADCHSDNPGVNNFGNIWSGRNAVSLIQRAVSSNTGGMGYFASVYSAADLADIAAYLGNSPGSLSFSATPAGFASAAKQVTISSSTKLGIENLSIRAVGDFLVTGGNCGATVARFSSCNIEITFFPVSKGQKVGAILLTYDGLPAPVRISLTGEAL